MNRSFGGCAQSKFLCCAMHSPVNYMTPMHTRSHRAVLRGPFYGFPAFPAAGKNTGNSPRWLLRPRCTVPTCGEGAKLAWRTLAAPTNWDVGCRELLPSPYPGSTMSNSQQTPKLPSRNQWRFQSLAAVPHPAWNVARPSMRGSSYHSGFMDEPTHSTTPVDCLSGGRPRSGPREELPAHIPDDDDAISVGP